MTGWWIGCKEIKVIVDISIFIVVIGLFSVSTKADSQTGFGVAYVTVDYLE